jgi:hypothetical protein
MPKKKPIPDQTMSDELVLAAIERTERHQRRDNETGVLLATIKEHLGLARHGWSTRRLLPQLEELQTVGQLERSRRYSVILWGLTNTGRERLAAARAAGEIGTLPESPQHRQWREARTAANGRIGEFRDDLRRALADATRLLYADGHAPSDAWFEFSGCLKDTCWRLGSSTHCLTEWPEPDDASADIDTHGQYSRRHTWLWGDC